ncbi:uncharacterized protein LOC6541136 [Drosophila erecta]|uniref:MD-2-related lipid-recognition domain-containing protein n=1 Tax=Drosophila erecta TaxID=7220 RepID=B3N801_DROER|nr:uncharacterized protein LOC6541136 [Drosophila erecta]EDV58362.1 uncharacterized protein Dere_GG24027 [Drosophila erecta]
MMYAKPTLLIWFLVLMFLIKEVRPRVEFTNLKCTSVDEDFAEFSQCTLKSINRTYKYVSVRVKLYKLPITKARVNFGLYKRFNGYKPFLYNQTVDGCRFFNRQKANPVAKYFFDMIKDASNLNHSCPYNHDLIVEKVSIDTVDHHVTNILPYPKGDYMLETQWMLNDKFAGEIQVYLSLF